MIKAAISAAQAQAAVAAAQAMSELTGGMKLPGMEGLLG
jgi:DNA-binding protein YbaB